MSAFQPRDPDWEARIRDGFARQGLMRLFAAEMVEAAPGRMVIALPFRPELTQHHGFLHAAALTAIGDNAAGFAAGSLMAPGFEVLTVEFKFNFVAPATGERAVATAEVLRPGRTLTLCDITVEMEQDGRRSLCAKALATMMAVSL